LKNLYGFVKPALRKKTTESIRMFSEKRYKWEAAIHEVIEPDQLRPRFGGTMDDPDADRVPPDNDIDIDLKTLSLKENDKDTDKDKDADKPKEKAKDKAKEKTKDKAKA
jgi:hypothetical protein